MDRFVRRTATGSSSVDTHPLGAVLFERVQGAMRDVRDTRLGCNRMCDVVSTMRGNVGSVVGTLFEHYLAAHVAPEFVPQREKFDADFVCPSDRRFDFEVKTTSARGDSICGNRVTVTSRKSATYLLAVQYEPSSLQVLRVRFGWVHPDDWEAQRGNGQQSYLKAAARARLHTL